MKLTILALGAMAAAQFGHAATTISPTNAFAYGANVGWINARGDVSSGVVIGQHVCLGYAWAANVGWIHFGDGSPADGIRYSNTAADDCGVNHDGAGSLRGNAWGANVGWINFESAGNPRVDLRTGNLSGYAYGANVGWISLSNAVAHVRTDRLDTGPDTDSDALPDAWEYGHTNVLAALKGGLADADGDGATDTQEYLADTAPFDPDDHLRITALAVAGPTNTVSWSSRPTRQYRLEATTRMTETPPWGDSGAGLMGPPPSSPMSVQLTGVTATSRFYRVRADVPLAP